MKSKFAKMTTLVAFSTLAGLTIAGTNVKADTNTTTNNVAVTQTAPSNVELYANSLVQVNNVQTVNFPSGYTYDALQNVNSSNNASFDNMARQGMSLNNYQSDPEAAKESVDFSNLTDDQTNEINQYGLALINNARAHFGEAPFTQNQGTINTVRNMALEYQNKNESLMNGHSHDQSIIQGNSENIAAQQIYTDNIPHLLSTPFAQVRGTKLLDSNHIPLITINNMDDMRAFVYYSIMNLLFNDGSENYGHAKNFLVYNQPINSMALYPSVTNFTGTGTTTFDDGSTRPFNFSGKNIDLHFIWANGSNSTTPNNQSHQTTPNNQTSSNQTNVDNGNYAWLDDISLNSDGQLHVAGWHATNQAQGRQYHFIIALDQNNHELGRVNITNNRGYRPDVKQAHNVYNADYSGFNTTLNLGNQLNGVTSIKVLSRYTSDPNGNSNYVDYWFNDKQQAVDQANHAWFDGYRITGNQIELTGWNATNQAANRPYHYIIMLVNGREVARQLVTPVTRNDVARAYPGVYNAGKSGFDVKFDLSRINFNDHVQFLSRYTTDAAGNGNYVDYWFNLTNGNPQNQAWLDNFSVDRANNRLNISGWNADDASQFETNHYIIVWDATAGNQVGSWKVNNVSRTDVARAYPQIANAGNSGFNLSLNLSQLHLVPGHTYQVVSRYSTANTGNGNGNGQQYTDYWYAGKVLL